LADFKSDNWYVDLMLDDDAPFFHGKHVTIWLLNRANHDCSPFLMLTWSPCRSLKVSVTRCLWTNKPSNLWQRHGISWHLATDQVFHGCNGKPQIIINYPSISILCPTCTPALGSPNSMPSSGSQRNVSKLLPKNYIPLLVDGWKTCEEWYQVIFKHVFEGYPLVKKHSYWKWPFIVDLYIENGDFP
jgi:hypothetical protein